MVLKLRQKIHSQFMPHKHLDGSFQIRDYKRKSIFYYLIMVLVNFGVKNNIHKTYSSTAFLIFIKLLI